MSSGLKVHWKLNSYYDEDGRVVQVKASNHLGGTDITNQTYNFAGELTASTRTHTGSPGGAATTIATRYEYDHMGRKLATMESINGEQEVVLNKLEYNTLGQLLTKHLHSTDNGSSFLQRTDYVYNERGWLKENNSNQFKMRLKYDDGTVPQYNGNIANQEWGTSYQNVYAYGYDPLNRLKSGVSTGVSMSEVLSYDVMGNIKTLNRDNSGIGTYNYQGNRLQNIINGPLATATYIYDPNGNVITDGRNGVSLTYNYLNLPATATKTGLNLSYTYDASGNKLTKISNGVVRHYLSGIEYDGNRIDIIHTEEGVARNNPGGSYSYEYNLSDHLGNVRYTFNRHPTTGVLTPLQSDDYYAFGKRFANGGVNKYLYNGKELQEELGQLDYGARFYDPVIGRWNVVDPLAELFDDVSPYNYVMNNPILLVDPDGMAADTIKRDIPKPPIQLKEVIIKSGPMKGLVATGQTGFFAVPYRLPQAVIQANQAEAAAFLGRWTPLGRVLTVINNLLEMTPKTLNFSKSKEGGELSKKITDAQRKLIREWFLKKSNPGDPTPEMPEGIEKETLQTYKAIAEKAIKEGIDKSGEQARRLNMIEAVLK